MRKHGSKLLFIRRGDRVTHPRSDAGFGRVLGTPPAAGSTQIFPTHGSPTSHFSSSRRAPLPEHPCLAQLRDPQELQRTTAATSQCYSGSTSPFIDCNTLQGISVDCHCALSPPVFSCLNLDTVPVSPGVTASPFQRELALGPSQPRAFFFPLPCTVWKHPLFLCPTPRLLKDAPVFKDCPCSQASQIGNYDREEQPHKQV